MRFAKLIVTVLVIALSFPSAKVVSAVQSGDPNSVGIVAVGGGVLDAASPYAFELYQYDALNRLVKSDTMAGTAEYAYNAAGLRVAKTVNGVLAKYVWDGGQIAAELSGSVTARYTRGIGLIKSDTSWYLFNAHGDVVQLTNSSGAVTKDYNYDAFGIEGSPDSTDVNSFRYAGEYYDRETGTYYLRARYYSPRTGRFTTEDQHWNTDNMIYGDSPHKINSNNDPLGLSIYTYTLDIEAIRQSANLYVYALNNPILYCDPSGKIVWLTMAIGGLIGGLVGGGANVLAQGFTKGWDNINWGEVGVAAGSGALSGVLAGSGAGLIVVITGNAAIGSGSYAATQAINGDKITINGLLVNAGVGAIFGAIGGSSKMQVKELTALHQAYKTAIFNSGKEINKMLFQDLFMEEMVKSPVLQGVRDEVIQFFLDELLQTDFSQEVLNDIDSVFKRIVGQN